MTKSKKISLLIVFILVPICIILGIAVFKNKNYNIMSIIIALMACVPFFVTFEKSKSNTRKMVAIAVMVALSVAGRMLFTLVPHFKPVTAIVVLAAIYFGPEAGFMTGSLTAIISNIYFGQGPWTPFQMFAWGITGFIAGLMANPLLQSKLNLCLFGFFAGIFFSIFMDIWTMLSMDSGINIKRFIAIMGTSAIFTITYAVSNVVFFLLLAKPIGGKLQRVKDKYGI